MEYGNSVVRDFEAKCENSDNLRKKRVHMKCELKDDGCKFQSDNDTNHLSNESALIDLDAPENNQNILCQINDGDFSGSTCKNEWNELLSKHTKLSLTCSNTPNTGIRNNEGYNDNNNDVSCSLEGKFEVQIQKKDDYLDHSIGFSRMSDVKSNDDQCSIDKLYKDRNKGTGNSENIACIAIRKASESFEEMELLDFKAEEMQDAEKNKPRPMCEMREGRSDKDRLKGYNLEEGEIIDEENTLDETEPRKRTYCQFDSRDQCILRSSGRFVHVVRPRLPVSLPTSIGMQKPTVKEPIFESAWERGIRKAKEIMRLSENKKNNDKEYEEKKMNISLGQQEHAKGNYFHRFDSPVYKEDERWYVEDPYCYRDITLTKKHYDDISNLHHHRPRESERDYLRRVHYDAENSTRRKFHRHHRHSQEFYEKCENKSNRKLYSTRIVTEERDEHRKSEWYYNESSLPNRRGDEWADPWMRSNYHVERKSRDHNLSIHSDGDSRKIHLPTPRTIKTNSSINISSHLSSKHVGKLRDFGLYKPILSQQRQKEVQPHYRAMMPAENSPPPPSPARSNSSEANSSKVAYSPKNKSCLIMKERDKLPLAAETLKMKAMNAKRVTGQKHKIKLTLNTSSSTQNLKKE